MQATLPNIGRNTTVGPWLVTSRLSETQAASARVTWQAAERLTRLVFGVAGLVARAYGPDRLNRRRASAPLATRYL
jgi:hypothetical protein